MIRELVALTRRELLRIRRNPQAIITSLLLPVLYLILFGQAFNLQNLGGGQVPAAYFVTAFRGAPSYFSYFATGMTGFVAVTATLFIGANVIFDRLFGVLKRTAATPATATSIFGSRLLASIDPTGRPRLPGVGPRRPAGPPRTLGSVDHRLRHRARRRGDRAGDRAPQRDVRIAVHRDRLLARATPDVFRRRERDQPPGPADLRGALPVGDDAALAAERRLLQPDHPGRERAAREPVRRLVGLLSVPDPAVYLLGLFAWGVAMFVVAVLLARRALAPRQ